MNGVAPAATRQDIGPRRADDPVIAAAGLHIFNPGDRCRAGAAFESCRAKIHFEIRNLVAKIQRVVAQPTIKDFPMAKAAEMVAHLQRVMPPAAFQRIGAAIGGQRVIATSANQVVVRA